MQSEQCPRGDRRTGFWGGFLVGAVLMFVFDPTANRRIRTEITDRARGLARRTGRRLGRSARHAWSEGVGAEQRMAHRHPEVPVDDGALLDRIQSEIYRDPLIPKGEFDIDIARGVTILRGELGDAAAIERVVSAVRAVEGVGDVTNLLHLPATPAPNKLAALEAGDHDKSNA